jgi:GNAT superfamily N-acetyltransferase
VSALRIEKLARHHQVDDFDCGTAPLNIFLQRYALANQLANASQNYLGLSGDTVVGFHTLAVGEIACEEVPERMRKGLARHPVPVMVLARLAVDTRWKGKGLGAGLLKDAMLRTVNASEIAGIRAIVVDAKNDDARRFYQHFGFLDGFADPQQMYLLTKDIR